MNEKLLKLIIKQIIAEQLLEEGMFQRLGDWGRKQAVNLAAVGALAGAGGAVHGMHRMDRANQERVAQSVTDSDRESLIKSVREIRTAIENSGEQDSQINRGTLDRIKEIEKSSGENLFDNLQNLRNHFNSLKRSHRATGLPDYLQSSMNKFENNYRNVMG